MKKKILIIITARGGSTRIKNKNLKIFNKKPLLYWTIRSAQKSKCNADIYVSSENKNILKVAKNLGSEIIHRPKILSNKTIMPDAAIKHAMLKIKKNYAPAAFELGIAEISLCNKLAAKDAFKIAKRDRNYRKSATTYLKQENFDSYTSHCN